MDFHLTDEQRMLRQEARDFLARHCSATHVRQWLQEGTARPPDLWRRLTELGWLGFALPAEHGGLGGGFFDLALLFECGGAALVPTVFASTTGAALSVLAIGTTAQARRWLPAIARGECTGTVALTESEVAHDPSRFRTTLTRRGSRSYVLSGRKSFVENGADADLLVVAARRQANGTGEEDFALVALPRERSGVQTSRHDTFSRDPQAEIVFDAVEVPDDAVLGCDGERVRRVLERLTVLLCADMLGGFGRVLEITTEYVRGRTQFGRPIGSFQAVQHALADMAIALEGARYTTYQAAWRLDRGLPAAREVAIAKAWTSPAYKHATLVAHQLHGGMGFVTEYDLHLYSDRAKSSESRLGGVDRHLEVVARALQL
jgi:alkylation response protein AidB-like acyl-CoA dehydrogenase